VTIAQVEAIRQAPAIALTRDGIAKRMIEASVLVRAEDARLLHETRDLRDNTGRSLVAAG